VITKEDAYFAAATMNGASTRIVARKVAANVNPKLVSGTANTSVIRMFSAAAELPDSITRVATVSAFPNEYPGQNYMFNWALNADGVTPLKKSAFRIAKPLDLKVAGLDLPKTSPLNVSVKGQHIPEAGSEELDFDTFDKALQSTKDALSLSDSLFCPEGHAPGTRTGVRVISNTGAGLAPNLMAYLDRSPKRDPKSQPVTCYVLSGVEEFSGYAIEEVEETMADKSRVAVSVATVVVTGRSPSLEQIVSGIELSVKGLEADAKERAENKAGKETAK